MERGNRQLGRNKPNTMKIAIFTNINSPATDFYRTVGCYAYMGHDIRYLAIESAKWYDLMDVDVVVAWAMVFVATLLVLLFGFNVITF